MGACGLRICQVCCLAELLVSEGRRFALLCECPPCDDETVAKKGTQVFVVGQTWATRLYM
jgi:hypothetical protein